MVSKSLDGVFGDSHLVNLIRTVSKSGPACLLHHVRQWGVRRIAEGTMNLNGAVNNSVQTIGNKMLGHRNFGSEIVSTVNLEGRVQDHQLALVELHRRVGDEPLHTLFFSQQ